MRKEPGDAYMLANEAIVRAALESDVKVVSFYPGAPQTEVLDTFEKCVDHFDFRPEIATNEKVALETVAGASFVGLRSLTSMKSVGTNVASDTLYSLGYTGVEGGCVCVIADDPHAHSSQSEQDGRWFGYTGHMPMLEPANAQEAMDMVKFAFDLSEKYGVLVLVRTTTRVNHQSGIVKVGEINRTPFGKTSWKDKTRVFRTLGAIARENKGEAIEKLKRMAEDFETSDLVRVEHFDGRMLSPGKGGAELGIIASGVVYNYAVEGLQRLDMSADILKLGVLNPLPEKVITEFIKPLKKLVVVEELFPYLETFITALAKDANPGLEIIGKRTGYFHEVGEYNIPVLVKALSEATGTPMPFDYFGHFDRVSKLAEILPGRSPVFCAGCPHRATMWSLRKAVKVEKKIFFADDIGCYSMMTLPPVEWTDSLLAMGASLGVSAGVQYGLDEKVVAPIGDSTFYHAALPGIVNAVHNKDDITILLLDNHVTAMTGQQGNPGWEDMAGGKPGKRVEPLGLLKGMGVEKIYEIDTYADVKANADVIKEAIDYDGPSVVLVHGECALYHFRQYRRAGGKIVPYYVDKEKCENRFVCIFNFMCPALSVGEDGHAQIDPAICVGCGVCAQICPHGAIKSTATLNGGDDKPITTVEQYAEYEKAAGGKEVK